jgi:fumarate hydratase class II
MEYRIEKDTMGEVKVPADAYYGAQTQRSIDNFKIAQDINKMPKEIIRAFAWLKKAAAITNYEAACCQKINPFLSVRSAMKFWTGNWMIPFHWWYGKPVVVRKAI